MQLKKIIPVCLVLVMLCGCSSSSTSSKNDKKVDDNTTSTSETVDTKDLITVKGTMNVPEDFKSSNLEGTTIEYTVDKEGYVYTLNFHKVSGETPIDGDKTADANDGKVYYISESEIPNWKTEREKEEKISKKGYSVTLTMGDELTKEQAMAANGEETAYSAIYDYSLDSFKATNKTIKDCADILDVKTKNNKITEKSLKKMLEYYYMVYTNE